MSDGTDGHHHVTVISSDPQATIDVYSRVLGLRLKKRAVNADGSSTYHLYSGDGTGTPWTVLTCFPFRQASHGRVVPDGSIGYWQDRLDAAGADVDAPVDLLPRTREVLVEIATDGPGSNLDEDADSLGASPKLPPWLEQDRSLLESWLPDVDVGTPTGGS